MNYNLNYLECRWNNPWFKHSKNLKGITIHFIQQSIFQKYAHGAQSSWLFFLRQMALLVGASYRTFSQQKHGQKEVGNWLASSAWMNLDKNWIISASVPLSTTTGPENVIKRRAKKLTLESAPRQYQERADCGCAKLGNGITLMLVW